MITLAPRAMLIARKNSNTLIDPIVTRKNVRHTSPNPFAFSSLVSNEISARAITSHICRLVVEHGEYTCRKVIERQETKCRRERKKKAQNEIGQKAEIDK